ncbi:MAG: hypothetical protein V1802_01590 [Candidatus Aenigmatarchaeota archaeon]
MSFERAYRACKNCYELDHNTKNTMMDGPDRVKLFSERNMSTYEAMRALERKSDRYVNDPMNAPGFICEGLRMCAVCDYSSPKIAELLEEQKVFKLKTEV